MGLWVTYLLLGRVLFIESKRIAAEPITDSVSRSLQTATTAPYIPDGYAKDSFSFAYQMYTKNTSQTPTVDSAVQKVQSDAYSSVSNMTSASTDKVVVRTVGNTTLVPCSQVRSNYTGYDACNDANTTIETYHSTDVPSSLVQEAVLGHVSEWTHSFNDENEDIQLAYASPLFVDTDLAVKLVGVNEPMEGDDLQAFLDTFTPGFEALMKTNNVTSFDLQDVQVISQQPLTFDEEDALLVTLYIQAACGGSMCTDEQLQKLLVSQGAIFDQALAYALKNGALPYFDALKSIIIGAEPVSNTANEIPPIWSPELESEPLPFWLWIVIGVDILLLLSGLVFAMIRRGVRRRNKSIEQENALAEKRKRLDAPIGRPESFREQPQSDLMSPAGAYDKDVQSEFPGGKSDEMVNDLEMSGGPNDETDLNGGMDTYDTNNNDDDDDDDVAIDPRFSQLKDEKEYDRAHLHQYD